MRTYRIYIDTTPDWPIIVHGDHMEVLPDGFLYIYKEKELLFISNDKLSITIDEETKT